MSIFARDDDDFGYRTGPLKCFDRVCDHRFAVQRREKFIEPHAAAAAGRDDDGR